MTERTKVQVQIHLQPHIHSMISDIVHAHLDSDTPDEYDPLIRALTECVQKQLESTPSPIKAQARPKASQTSNASKTSKSSKTNPYSHFVKVLASVKKKERPDIGDIEVTIGHNFKDTNAACAKRYQEYQDKLLFNDAPIDGQTMKFIDLCNVVASAGNVYSAFANGMTQTGLIWGLISPDKRTEILGAD